LNYGPSASSSWEPDYDHATDDPLAWGNYQRWDWSLLRPKAQAWGEVRRWLTHLYIIFCRYFVYPCFAFFFFVVLVFISTFQNTKRPKIFPLFLFVCLFSFLVLVCFTF
jgi:hypothetical protein